MTRKATFKIVGPQKMHCSGCESTVSFALSKLPQLQQVDADRKAQQITVLTTSDADLRIVQDELR